MPTYVVLGTWQYSTNPSIVPVSGTIYQAIRFGRSMNAQTKSSAFSRGGTVNPESIIIGAIDNHRIHDELLGTPAAPSLLVA